MAGGAVAALGGVFRGVALAGGLDWDGQPLEGLLGKGDHSNKAARGEGEGEREGPRAREWSSLPAKTTQAHHRLDVQGTWLAFPPLCGRAHCWPTSRPVSWLVGWCSN